MPTLLELRREGRFNSAKSMIPNTRKCGSMASKVYSYSVHVEATDERLTPEGFVLNNELIHTYFVGKFGPKAPKWDAISCELMARTAANDLAEIIRKANVDCLMVRVSLTGSNGATITATWRKGN